MDNMCEACPNRALANLNRSLGNEQEARRIELAGCGWWWGINYTNKETGVTKLVYACGKSHIAKIVMDQGALVEEALQTSQSTRNQQAKDMEELKSVVVNGLGNLWLVSQQMPSGEKFGDKLLEVTKE